MTTRDPLPEKTPRLKSVLVAGAVFGGFCLLWGGLEAYRTLQQDQRQREVLQAITRIDQERAAPALQNLRKLAAAAPGVSIPFDDLHYAYLHDRWREILWQFDQLLAARENRYIGTTLPEFLDKTRKGLTDLRAECSNYLQDRPEHSTPRAAWKVYNLRGCLAAMAAYLSLEFDSDGRESGKFLNDAIEDFKTALKHADQEKASTFERMLPAWNLELVVGAGETFVIGQDIMEENMINVEALLAPVLPNFGGYSPGAPLDIYVDK